MRRIRSGCCERLLAAGLTLWPGSTLQAQTVGSSSAEAACEREGRALHSSTDWRPVVLPFTARGLVCDVRVRFDVDPRRPGDRSLYLPYLYGGGDVRVNGLPVGRIATSTPQRIVRWERPFLVNLPAAALRPGSNELVLRVALDPVSARSIAPPLTIGADGDLADRYETRLFWVRTMSQVTATSAWVVGALVLAIWWRRREEVLYGLFGLLSLLWGVRTLNLVVESLPAAWWDLWRLAYLWSTGGCAVALLFFAMRVAGLRWRVFERLLIAYALACPVLFALSAHDDWLVGKLWSGGLPPTMLTAVWVMLRAAVRSPSVEKVTLGAVVSLVFVAGLHDYLVHADSPLLTAALPWAAAHRLFLLQYSAVLLLLVMGGILSARFVRTLGELAALNRTLEGRIAEREAVLTEKFQVIGALERRHAADEERQRIMRDLHDGLGSTLFVTLSQVEAGGQAGGAIAGALRACIADMRLTFEVMNLEDRDFMSAWADFRFRWTAQLDAAGVRSAWRTEPVDTLPALGAEPALHLLRIVQEALTNVLKHARATHVDVSLEVKEARLRIEVGDDGRGLSDAAGALGRGLHNMRSRAQAVGARTEFLSSRAGTTVRVEIGLEP